MTAKSETVGVKDYATWVEHTLNAHATLISGLEALAGEWLKHAVNYDNEAKDVISDVYYAQLTTHADECRSKALKIRALIPAAANHEAHEESRK